MPAIKYSDEIVNKVVDMKEGGYEYPEICAAMNLPKSTVYDMCVRMGVSIYMPREEFHTVEYTRSGHTVKRFTKREDQILTELRVQGKSLRTIARLMKRSRTSVIGRLRSLARHAELEESK